MAYRTVVVVDGANNLIECQMNLTDYSQRGEHPGTERFIDVELSDEENQALQKFIVQMLKKRQEQPKVLKHTIHYPNLQNSVGDMVASRYSQRGIISSFVADEDLPPLIDDNGKKFMSTSVGWDEENRLTMQFSGRDPLQTRLLNQELPVLSCPFMNALRELDDMTAVEKQKILDVLDMQERLPFSFPDGGFEFHRQRPLSKEMLAVAAGPPPDSPLSNVWLHRAKRERSKLTVSVNGDDDQDVNKNNGGCAYGTCPRAKKRSQIYCGHHLRLVSHKHQTQKALKRSRSSVDFGSGFNDNEDIDYKGIDGE